MQNCMNQKVMKTKNQKIWAWKHLIKKKEQIFFCEVKICIKTKGIKKNKKTKMKYKKNAAAVFSFI